MKLRMRPLFLLLAAFFLLGNVAACLNDIEGERGEVIQQSTFAVAINATTAAALVGLEFRFFSGRDIHPALARVATTLVWTSANTIEIRTASGTASASVTYGSCDYEVTTSTITGITVGTSGVISPCELEVTTLNRLFVGVTGTGRAVVQLRSTFSDPVDVTIVIDAQGRVFVNGVLVGQQIGGIITGTGGGG